MNSKKTQKEKSKNTSLDKTKCFEINCECIADGKYCPKIIISTNDKTEFVTIQFVSVNGVSLDTIYTKKQYKELVSKLIQFNNYTPAAKEKKLLLG